MRAYAYAYAENGGHGLENLSIRGCFAVWFLSFLRPLLSILFHLFLLCMSPLRARLDLFTRKEDAPAHLIATKRGHLLPADILSKQFGPRSGPTERRS